MIFYGKFMIKRFFTEPTGSDHVGGLHHWIRHVQANLFYFRSKMSGYDKTRNQRKTGHFRQNECHESAFLHSALRASRTSFQIEVFFE